MQIWKLLAGKFSLTLILIFKCPERVFAEPEPKEVHYIYQGETCDCLKHHDVIVEQPVLTEAKPEPSNCEFGIQVPAPQEEVNRYIFDVRVEKPVMPDAAKQ